MLRSYWLLAVAFGALGLLFYMYPKSSFNPKNHLATKTLYSVSETAILKEDSSIPAGYEPQRIWLLLRHGARNPSENVIISIKNILPLIQNEIIASHGRGKGQLSKELLTDLKRWTLNSNVSIKASKHLIEKGRAEMRAISRRFQSRFPELLGEKGPPRSVDCFSTETQRTKESLLSLRLCSDILYDTKIIRFYKHCRKWIDEVDKNQEAYIEKVKFEQSLVFQDLLDRVALRLGLKRKEVSVFMVELIYLACGMETAHMFTGTSVWCNLLNEDDFKVLEYRADIEYYYIDGYGHSINYEQACPLIGDIHKYFMIGERRKKKVKISATHSGTLLKFLSRLGLFKDSSPLLHDNFLQQTQRLWRTSKIDRFSSNIAFILYKNEEHYYIRTLYQERNIVLPFCNGEVFCPYAEFLKFTEKYGPTCDFENLCDNE